LYHSGVKQISPQHILIGLGVLIILGAFAYVLTGSDTPALAPGPQGSDESVMTNEDDSESSSTVSVGEPKPSGSTGTSSASPSISTKPPVPQTSPGTTPGTTTPTPETPTNPVPETPSVPAPTPTPYNPGFLASSRITPEIPSENERATLPACDTKLFTLEPVNFGAISSISATGRFSTSHPSEYALFTLGSTGQFAKYDFSAPGDVWITHIAQEYNISGDPEDTTIYFALCRDVVGYVTHVKELSEPVFKYITDSYCFGKSHTGPNACHIKILDLISKGSLLGKVGGIEGAFGFGVIDLRTQTNFNNPASFPIKTNFAACPFPYFTNPSSFLGKLTGASSLCPTQ
jgi:hypothetical protein